MRNLFIPTKYRGQTVGVDGFMVDIMRSRDSGVAPFTKFVDRCFSKKVQSWDDLEPYFESKHLKLLRKLYEDVNDVDLMAALLLEKRCNNLIGQIGGCIMAEQFYRYRYGDRFFYSHSNNPHKFTTGSTHAVVFLITKLLNFYVIFKFSTCFFSRTIERD